MEYTSARNKHSEMLSKRSTLRAHLMPFFGDMRLDEIRPLQIEDYKADSPKSNKDRDIPLSRQALEALRAQRHLRGPYVFCDLEGKQLCRDQCVKPLEQAAERAGLRRITWHVLRHTFASHLVMRGVPLKAVQELLEHASMEMTMKYAHLAPSVRQAAVEVLDQPAPRVDPGLDPGVDLGAGPGLGSARGSFA